MQFFGRCSHSKIFSIGAKCAFTYFSGLVGRTKNWCFKFITRPNCALDRSTILCLYVPGFQRQVFKDVKILSERSKESKEQKKNKGSVLLAESAYNAQNAQFGFVMLGQERTFCWQKCQNSD